MWNSYTHLVFKCTTYKIKKNWKHLTVNRIWLLIWFVTNLKKTNNTNNFGCFIIKLKRHHSRVFSWYSMSKQLQILKYIWFGKKAYLYGWEEIFLEGNIVCFSKLDKKCHYKWDKHTCNSSQTVIHIAYIDKILYHIGFILFFLWKWTRHPINIDNMIIRDSVLYQLCHVISLDLQVTEQIIIKSHNT